MMENEPDVNCKVRRGEMLLAGDLGGTTTRIGLFDQLPMRPRPLAVREYSTIEHTSLAAIVTTFSDQENLDAGAVKAAAFGVAGPVINHVAQLTNVPWSIDGRALRLELGLAKVAILNDLAAMAYAIPLLTSDERYVLQAGDPVETGNGALIAAGTGLGEVLLKFENGGLTPSASESGHADFAARNETEIALLRRLIQKRGRASVEDVVSGRGLVAFHALTHVGPCPALSDTTAPDAPALISTAALEKRCPGCTASLEHFVDAYGAEAGNLALRTLATRGVFIGGGIAPKILPAMTDGRFVEAFVSKAPFEPLLRRVPITIILDDRIGLLGAAAYAARLFAGRAPAAD